MSTATLGTALAAIAVVVGVLASVAGLTAARGRAQAAADAAALAALGAAPLLGGSGAACDAAEEAAAANGAALLRCDGPGDAWGLEVEVEVQAVLRLPGAERVLPPVRAVAAALLEPVGIGASTPGDELVGERDTGVPPGVVE